MCEGDGEAEFDPKELLCSGCTEFSAQENCKIHGKEWCAVILACVNLAAWDCYSCIARIKEFIGRSFRIEGGAFV